eukprot:TRINITY_DN4645_c0_g1_i3.p1 TRINITY_DN4645_c0_g1~~TRINITY_DN4645_c0_g1_i3.p1  ORF type:complete len:731 (+),score=140.74 TRINITY_DN4645_c0_g1_i3:26-2194(+)
MGTEAGAGCECQQQHKLEGALRKTPLLKITKKQGAPSCSALERGGSPSLGLGDPACPYLFHSHTCCSGGKHPRVPLTWWILLLHAWFWLRWGVLVLLAVLALLRSWVTYLVVAAASRLFPNMFPSWRARMPPQVHPPQLGDLPDPPPALLGPGRLEWQWVYCKTTNSRRLLFNKITPPGESASPPVEIYNLAEIEKVVCAESKHTLPVMLSTGRMWGYVFELHFRTQQLLPTPTTVLRLAAQDFSTFINWLDVLTLFEKDSPGPRPQLQTSSCIFVHQGDAWREQFMVLQDGFLSIHHYAEVGSFDVYGASVTQAKESGLPTLTLTSPDQRFSVTLLFSTTAEQAKWQATLRGLSGEGAECEMSTRVSGPYTECKPSWLHNRVFKCPVHTQNYIFRTANDIYLRNQAEQHLMRPSVFPKQHDYFFILSIDGGGVKGAIPVMILERLEKQFPGLIERMDLVSGVSIGGTVAYLYAYGFGTTCVRGFGDLGARVTMSQKRGCGLFNAKYSLNNLEVLASEIFRENSLSDSKKFLVFPTCLVDNSKSGHERSFEPHFTNNIEPKYKAELARNCVVRGCAAPTFFPAYNKYVDGAIMCNTCCDIAIAYAHAHLGVPMEKIVCLSIGTGSEAIFMNDTFLHRCSRSHDWGILQWGLNFSKLIDIQQEKTIDMCKVLLGDRMHRVQVFLPRPVCMEDTTQVPYIAEQVERNLAAIADRTSEWIRKYLF